MFPSLYGADDDLSCSPQGLWGHARGGRVAQGAEGHRVAATLTSAGSSVHEGAVALVMEEEVGSILIVTEDVRGAAAEDGAHADTPAPWKRTLTHSKRQKQSSSSAWGCV